MVFGLGKEKHAELVERDAGRPRPFADGTGAIRRVPTLTLQGSALGAVAGAVAAAWQDEPLAAKRGIGPKTPAVFGTVKEMGRHGLLFGVAGFVYATAECSAEAANVGGPITNAFIGGAAAGAVVGPLVEFSRRSIKLSTASVVCGLGLGAIAAICELGKAMPTRKGTDRDLFFLARSPEQATNVAKQLDRSA